MMSNLNRVSHCVVAYDCLTIGVISKLFIKDSFLAHSSPSSRIGQCSMQIAAILLDLPRVIGFHNQVLLYGDQMLLELAEVVSLRHLKSAVKCC